MYTIHESIKLKINGVVNLEIYDNDKLINTIQENTVVDTSKVCILGSIIGNASYPINRLLVSEYNTPIVTTNVYGDLTTGIKYEVYSNLTLDVSNINSSGGYSLSIPFFIGKSEYNTKYVNTLGLINSDDVLFSAVNLGSSSRFLKINTIYVVGTWTLSFN